MNICADCGMEKPPLEMFDIAPPKGRDEGGGQPYYICVPCWEQMLGGALMSAIRGM